MPYFDEPVGRVKILTTSKNSQRYYTTKRLIRDLLSNTQNFYVRAGECNVYLYTAHLSSHGGLQFLLKGNQINIKSLIYKRLSTNRSNQMLVFGERGKPEYPGENLS